MVTFAIICLANEDDTILQTFLAHYLGMGATEIALFVDRAEDGMPVSLEHFSAQQRDRILLTYCDDGYWGAMGTPRPAMLEDRQRAVFNAYFRQCKQDWLLVCDADEFLVSPAPLAEVLEHVPEEVSSVTFPPVEAVWGPGDDIDTAYGNSWFRAPFSDAAAWRRESPGIYGCERFLMSGRGAVGHDDGKSMTRTNGDASRLNLHWATVGKKIVSVPSRQVGAPLTSVCLVHFDAINFSRWRRKFRRRGGWRGINGGRGSKRRVRQRRVVNFANLLGPNAGRIVFRRFYCLTARQLALLQKQDLVQQLQLFDPPRSRQD